VPKQSINRLEEDSPSIDITIFVADVSIQLDEKKKEELKLSTKKDPPSRLRYELAHVSSDTVQRPAQIGSYLFSDGKG
jgi:hypothetical protein